MSGAPAVLVSGVVLGQPMGGVRRHNQELLPRLARRLAAEGGRLAVLEGREPLAFALPESVERIASTVPARPPLLRSLMEGRALGAALEAAARAGRPFELVHLAHLPVPARLPLPYTLTVHDLRALALEHSPFSRRFVAKSVIGAAVRGAACVLAPSESVRAQLVALFGLDPRRTAVVPNAAEHLAPLPRAPAADAPLLCVAHLEPRKNQELLLAALAHDPTLPALVLAGAAKGEERERLEARARELGVAARVRFLGAFEERELAPLYARCACVVLPSTIEGFCIPALEAQRARAPLAIADAGALPEVAPDAPRFPPRDPAACAAAIRAALARTPAQLEADALRAARYTWDDSAERWLAAWRAASA